MTEPGRESTASPVVAPAGEATAASPGSQLRRWREAQGLHVAMLAASLKVPPQRLEALEADRWDALPDPAFTRALAQSVCRVLKRDPAPVLAGLPRPDGNRLEQVAAGVNAPFRDRPGSIEPGMGQALRRPALWAVVALLLAALAVWFWPVPLDHAPATAPRVVDRAANGAGVPQSGSDAAGPSEPVSPVAAATGAEPAAPVPTPGPQDATEPAAGAGGVPAAGIAAAGAGGGAAAGDAVASLPDAAAPVRDTPGTPPAAAASTAVLGLSASAESWIEVRDADDRIVVSRTLRAGESVEVDVAPPLRLTIGNAAATSLSLRGQPVDLGPYLRGNVARIQLP
jgi:cytoskeleton protein RodZ